MPSIAEERIRLKAEALLRTILPGARIIHELVTGQYGPSRIDVAAVSTDMIIGLEVKSERDVLHRLPNQFTEAMTVCDHFAVCTTAKIAEKIEHLKKPTTGEYEDVPGMPGCRRGVRNPDYIDTIHHLDVFVEDREGGLDIGRAYWANPNHPNRAFWFSAALHHPIDKLEMLWAEELRIIAAPYGAKRHWTRQDCIREIYNQMPGRAIRKAVCAALRSRAFPRADAIIALEAAE